MEKIFDTNSFTERKPQAVLVSLLIKGEDEAQYMASLEELKRLLDTAGGECFAVMTQSKDCPDKATYIGSGKLDELRTLCITGGCELVVFDSELTPSQIRNIEKALECSELEEITVIDRSMLILDIFALHALTGEGKAQVELAQLKYTAPRLVGKGKSMSRLGGGIGTRGPGESKLESDRRHLQRRMAALENEIAQMAKNREVQRKKRDSSFVAKVAIAGYTNAGKSTLLNYLTGAGILAEDKLFATLDPTTRKFTLPSGNEMLLTDTVGFIRNLPTHLIKAFHSTLDEVKYSDALIVLIDSSDSESDSQLSVTHELLAQLGAGDKPIIYAMNKCDCVESFVLPPISGEEMKNIVMISAKTGEGIDSLIEKLEVIAASGRKRVDIFLPNSRLGFLDMIYKNGSDITVEYTASGAEISAVLDLCSIGRLKEFISGSEENEENDDSFDE